MRWVVIVMWVIASGVGSALMASRGASGALDTVHDWQEGLGALVGALLGAAAVIVVAAIQIRHAREEARQARIDAETVARQEHEAITYRRARAISNELNMMFRNLREDLSAGTSLADTLPGFIGAPDKALVLESLLEHVGDFGDELSTALVDTVNVLALLRTTREHLRAVVRDVAYGGAYDAGRKRIYVARDSVQEVLRLAIKGMEQTCHLLDNYYPPKVPINWDSSEKIIKHRPVEAKAAVPGT